MIAGKLALGLVAGILAACAVLYFGQSMILALAAYSVMGVSITLIPALLAGRATDVQIRHQQQA